MYERRIAVGCRYKYWLSNQLVTFSPLPRVQIRSNNISEPTIVKGVTLSEGYVDDSHI